MELRDARPGGWPDSDDEGTPSGSPPLHKVYAPPLLVVYGRLVELTAAVGNVSFDGIIGSREAG